MKYIEEIHFGDCFMYNNIYYILTTDFKKNNARLAVSLKDGSGHWFEANKIVEKINLYTLDQSNNIVPIKEHANEFAEN